MKNLLFQLLSLFTFSALSIAAPRLVVSTPSLVPESKIDIVFEQPMVSQENLGKEVANDLVKIAPALRGKLFWKAPTIAEFRPDQIPEIGVKYHFSAGKGLRHLDGSEIGAGEFAEISSEPFRIYNARIRNRWDSNYSAARVEWMVVFNDDVDPASVSGFFAFSSDRNQRIAPSVRYATAEEAGYLRTSYLKWANRIDPEKQKADVAPETLVKNVVIVSPNSPLPVAKKWEFRVLKGLPNAAGSTGLAEDVSYHIGEVEVFQCKQVDAFVAADSPRSIRVNFNRPLDENFSPDMVNVTPMPANMAMAVEEKTLTISGDFSARDRFSVSLSKDIRSDEGQALANAKNFPVKFERLAAELALPSEDEAQLAHGLRKYAINTVNLSTVRIRIKALSGKGLVRTYQGYRNYSGRGPNHSQVDPTSILPYALVPGQTLVDKKIDLGTAVDTGKILEISWDDFLPENTEYATLFVDVIGTPHPEARARGHRNAQAIVQLTDIGLAWKFTDQSALVFAFSCETGKPLEGVNLANYAEDAKMMEAVITDGNGLATVPRGKKIRHLNATLGSDSYTVAFDETLDRVGMWHFPVRYSWMKDLPEKRRAFLFTERSLYRPGEKVRIKGIVRDQLGNAIDFSKKAPARIVIIDPQEKEIFTQPVELSALGSFDLEYNLPAVTTGEHTIKLEFPDELKIAEKTDNWELQIALSESASFSLPLRVEEFRRNTFEVLQEIANPAPGAEKIAATVSAAYYQGQPVAAGNAVTFTEITDINPYPERYRDFLFGNHKIDDWRYWYNYFGYRDRDNENEVTRTSFDSEQVLSQAGKGEISVELPQSDFPVARQVSIATEITDANNQTLTARSTITVHPAALQAGISRIDRLVRVGEEMPFRIVVTDTEGEPAKDSVTLKTTLTRQVHTTTKTANENGDTVTESEASEEVVSTGEIEVSAVDSAKEGMSFPVTTANTGLHFLTVEGMDSDGRKFATVTRFHVYGADEYPWKYEDGMRIKLVSEKKSYQPGDVARVLVLSPIEGTALVTVEREKILSSYLTEIKADNPVIEIPLTDAHAPNAYVSILIVKGAGESAREIKEPQLRLGYCELTVENLRDHLSVEIDQPAESYRPATEASLSGVVKTAAGKPAAGAEVTLYAVDEGTLAVMGYDTPDPMAFFYDPRHLAVDAGTSFESFISENEEYRSFHNKGFFVGGGGDLNKLAELFRKNFDPSATWAPTLITDAEGRFSHKFAFPDTLTRYRVIAIAHHGGAEFGHAETAAVVKKPLMLEPKLPRFVNQGDWIETQVMVQNASGKAGTWEVTCATGTDSETATPPAELDGPAQQSITLAVGESGILKYPIKINDTGTVKISFRAEPLSLGDDALTPEISANLSDAVEETFISHFPMPLLRQVTALRITTDQTTDLRDLLSENLKTATGSIELEFATSPLVEISAAVDFLIQYPYGCLEQTSSAMMPWFAVKNLRPFVPAFAEKSDADVEEAISIGIGRLLSMQLSDGSFGYWPGAKETSSWATPYAGLALTLASQNGGNVPPSALESLSQYLIKSLRGAGEAKTSAALENHARSLYTLALLGKAQPAYHALMTEKLPFMSDSSRALLAASMAIAAEGRSQVLGVAQDILNSRVNYKTLEDGGYWTPGNVSSATRLIALLAIEPDSAETHQTLDRILNDRNPYGHWRSTWVNGWSLLAISQYASHQVLDIEKVDLTLDTMDGAETFSLTQKSPTAAKSLLLTPATSMKLKTSSPAYVRLKVAGKPALAPVAPVATNGLAVDRFYEKVLPSGQTEVLKQPALGDLIRVTLRVTLPEDDTRYLIVDDPLPAIFETVNSDFSSQSGGQTIRTSEKDWHISHSELRSDRALFFMDHVPRKGTYQVTYLARCTIPGEATAPPAKVESMYDPEKFALSASQKFATE